MIGVTALERQGVELLEPLFLAIDPEKIVSTRDRGIYCEIEYGETFDRRRQPITYVLNTDRASIDALIIGNYTDGLRLPYLELTVIWSLDREHRPAPGHSHYHLDLQEKYIVDIRNVTADINGVLTDCARIEFVPGSFVPVVIFVDGEVDDFITDEPVEVTTTTTTVAVTTTTTTSGQG
jgi:hypothetical protein